MTDLLTDQIISAAIEVHRVLGPGLLESIYMESNEFPYNSVFSVISVAKLEWVY